VRPDFVSPPSLYRDAPYEYAAVVPAGALVFTAGACPLDQNGKVVEPGNHEAQARQTVDNLRAALAAAGSSLEQVVKTTIYVVAQNQHELVRTWNVVAEAFGDSRPPSTLLGVALLGYTGQLVEIEAIALAGRRALSSDA
jgi:enamine deaminase RidA (YjgF/YER057c/UK114 family)